MEVVIDVLGWVGSVLILLAYGLNSYQKIRSDSWTFSVLNLSGAIFFIIYTLYKEAYANAFLNIVWAVIALIGMVRIFSKRDSTRSNT
jgi:hypothetical protein